MAPGLNPGLLAPNPMLFPPYPGVFKVTETRALLCLDVSTSGLQTGEFVERELHDHIHAAEDQTQQDLGRLGVDRNERSRDQSGFFQWSR